MNIFQIIKAVLSHPTTFFQKVGKGKDNLGFAFGYFAILSLFSGVLSWGVILLIFPFASYGAIYSANLGVSPIVINIIVGIASFIIGLGFSFLCAGLLHLWILIFGGKNSYIKTYELGAYAGTPSLLFSWIPFIGGLIGFVWSLILLIVGTQQVHKIDRTKTILMYLIPIGAIILLTILAWIFIIVALGAFLGTSLLSSLPLN